MTMPLAAALLRAAMTRYGPNARVTRIKLTRNIRHIDVNEEA